MSTETGIPLVLATPQETTDTATGPPVATTPDTATGPPVATTPDTATTPDAATTPDTATTPDAATTPQVENVTSTAPPESHIALYIYYDNNQQKVKFSSFLPTPDKIVELKQNSDELQQAILTSAFNKLSSNPQYNLSILANAFQQSNPSRGIFSLFSKGSAPSTSSASKNDTTSLNNSGNSFMSKLPKFPTWRTAPKGGSRKKIKNSATNKRKTQKRD